MPLNTGQIQIVRGTYGPECTAQNDLITNSASFPVIREMMDYVQRRQLFTLLTSGAVTPYGIDPSAKTRIPNVDTKATGRGIGSDAYQFRIMGDIEQYYTILGQVGSSGSNGTFTLKIMESGL